VMNDIRLAGRRYKQQAWDISRAVDLVEKEIRFLGPAFKGPMGAWPPKIQGALQKLTQGAAGKEGVPVNYPQLQRLIEEVQKEIAEVPKGSGSARRLYALQEMLTAIEGKGLKNVDGDLWKRWKANQDNYKTYRATWSANFEQGLTDLNTDQLANKFFRSVTNSQTVSDILGNLRKLGIYGQQQEELLRNVLRGRLRETLTRGVSPGEGVNIAGQSRKVKIGDQAFGMDTVSGAKFAQFQNEYGTWIKQLFPDDPNLEKFAATVARGEALDARYARIGKMERDLKDLSFLKHYDPVDLQRMAIDEPHKLYDLVWQQGGSSVQNTKSLRELNRILKRGLEPDQYALAQQRLKALTLKKIWDPDAEFAAASGKQYTPADATGRSLEFLNRERTALIEVFGESHFNNLQLLFKEMSAAANPTETGVAGFAARGVEKKGGISRIPGIIAKVWVGVLNRKARALTLGTRFVRAGEEGAFVRLLSDPKALDRALKLRASTTGRITANALGSILFGKEEGVIREDEIQALLDNYTTTDAQGNRQPIPIQTQEEGRTEAVDYLLEGYTSQ
ncbi:MAG TPA: hypothetical protein DCS66_13685, partial [Flavobacteriaceae bacterium]|nr:hypothetical protein [Flavobacteriaceae bacterium]